MQSAREEEKPSLSLCWHIQPGFLGAAAAARTCPGVVPEHRRLSWAGSWAPQAPPLRPSLKQPSLKRPSPPVLIATLLAFPGSSDSEWIAVLAPKGVFAPPVLKVPVSGEANYQQHMGSKKHARRLGQLAAGSVPQQGAGAAALAAQQAQHAQQPAPKTYLGPSADLAPYVDQVGP
jgi:hypothetical protein